MPARYTPLPNPRYVPDAQQEMEDAFESDGEEDSHGGEDQQDAESVPLVSASHQRAHSVSVPGTYDFERDYDYALPPPGSPPGPSSHALPGNSIGNSNGNLPEEADVVRPRAPGQSWIRRAVGSVLPTHYARLPASDVEESSRRIGGGMMNDGVFANVVAKPSRGVSVRTEEGEVHVVPEDAQKDAPPSYASAQADAVPPYWETTVHAPGGEFGAEMIVDDLPTGSLFAFASNCFVSFFFQFVGFLMTYLLHTTHAAKYGSRAGLGLTLIQYGFYSRSAVPEAEEDPSQLMPVPGTNDTTWLYEGTDGKNATMDEAYQRMMYTGLTTSREWLSFLLMTMGWFLLLSSLLGFWRVKRWEISIRTSSAPAAVITREDVERDAAVRRTLADVFGIEPGSPTGTSMAAHSGAPVDDENSGRRQEDDRRLQNLRAAGLLP